MPQNQNTKQSLHLDCSLNANGWINANLGILQISSILFFQWVWFCVFKQTLLGSHHSPEYCKLLVFLFPSVTACGDQNAAFYSKIYGVTPTFLFCWAFINSGFGTNPVNYILIIALHGDYNPRKLSGQKEYFCPVCALPNTLGSWFMIAAETVQLCREIMQAC